jgi:hypothetical protein
MKKMDNQVFQFKIALKGTLFFGKICTRTPPQTGNIPNHAKTPQNPKFFDVIAIADNSRSSCSISLKKLT